MRCGCMRCAMCCGCVYQWQWRCVERITSCIFLTPPSLTSLRYTWHTENLFPAFSYCHIEDGFLYKNKRGWHALFHSDCEWPQGHMAGGAAGGHAYSTDGKNWTFHPTNAYNNNVTLTDGSEWELARRERPKLIFDAAGIPTHLVNGVTLRGAANGCESGDHSFTFVQPIAQTRVVDADPSVQLGPFPRDLNWTNAHGGPLVPSGDPMSYITRPTNRPPSPSSSSPPPSPPPSPALTKRLPSALAPRPGMFTYAYQPGFWEDGNDLGQVQVDTLQAACDACTAVTLCRGFTYDNSRGGLNGTITAKTTVFLKKVGPCAGRRGGCEVNTTLPAWATWLKGAKAGPPASVIRAGGLAVALRADTFTAQWVNLSSGQHTNYSFVPPLTDGSALPLVHHLGDITLRVRAAGSSGGYDYFSSAFGPGAASAVPAAKLRPEELAAHDITALLAATNLEGASTGASHGTLPPRPSLPLAVRRAYLKSSEGGGGSLVVSFEVTNTATSAVEIGALGMSVPTAVSQDAHIGGDHGWVEWLRVHVNDALELDQSCIVAAPLIQRDNNSGAKATGGGGGGFEAYRPILEFGGGGFELTAHSRAWADEWRNNQQWPFMYVCGSMVMIVLVCTTSSVLGVWGNECDVSTPCRVCFARTYTYRT